MLKQTIESLAQKFTADVIDMLRRMPLDQLMDSMARTSPSPRNRAKTPATDPTPSIQTLLSQNPKGMRAEEITKALSLNSDQTAKALRGMLAANTVTKRGQKRSTVYKIKAGA